LAHELGHLAVARALGWPGRLGWVWRPIPYPVARVLVPAGTNTWSLLAVALAGPAASILFGFACWPVSPLAGLVSVLLGVVSLIPVPKQDGAHVLKALRS
jgi:Zn-dependent protease